MFEYIKFLSNNLIISHSYYNHTVISELKLYYTLIKSDKELFGNTYVK